MTFVLPPSAHLSTIRSPAAPLSTGLCRRNTEAGSCARIVVRKKRRPMAVRMLQVEKWDEKTLGPLSEEAMKKKLTSEGYSVCRYVFHPGTVFDYHDHGVTKKDSILTGRFLFRMDGQDVVLHAGDMIVVPAGKLHYAEVVGSEPVVFFDASKFS